MYAVAMGWSAQQKADARQELGRRRAWETRLTYRNRFFKAAATSMAIALLMVLWIASFRQSANLLHRGEAILLVWACAAAFLLTAALSYVRFVDWRRSTL